MTFQRRPNVWGRPYKVQRAEKLSVENVVILFASVLAHCDSPDSVTRRSLSPT